jgi:hypothetical protein
MFKSTFGVEELGAGAGGERILDIFTSGNLDIHIKLVRRMTDHPSGPTVTIGFTTLPQQA